MRSLPHGGSDGNALTFEDVLWKVMKYTAATTRSCRFPLSRRVPKQWGLEGRYEMMFCCCCCLPGEGHGARRRGDRVLLEPRGQRCEDRNKQQHQSRLACLYFSNVSMAEKDIRTVFNMLTIWGFLRFQALLNDLCSSSFTCTHT